MDLMDYSIGSTLYLDVYNDNGEMINRKFVSQFEEAINSHEAYIAIPIVEGVVYAVHVGWQITVFMRNGNSFYRFNGYILERKVENFRHLMRIKRISDIAVAQRRQYYRFQCELPFLYRVINNLKKDLDRPYIETTTIDISGAGICFRSTNAVLVQSLIECEVSVEEIPIYLIGKVVRCSRRTTYENDFRYEIGVLFSDIEPRFREIIVRYIFDEERKLISKQLN